MARLCPPMIYNPAELIAGIRIGVKIIASKYNFPDPKDANHRQERRAQVAECICAADLSQEYGMITTGAFIGRKNMGWEAGGSQEIKIGGKQGPEIDQLAKGRKGLLLVQVKSSGGGSPQIKGAAGHIVIDHLAPQNAKDHLTGLVYADTEPESRSRWTCVQALYEAFAGASHNATTLDQKLLGGSIPANTGISDHVRTAFYKHAGSSVGKVWEGFEQKLRELRNKPGKVLTGDETLRLIEPLQEMFGFQELVTLELPTLGDTIAAEKSLEDRLGPYMKEAKEVVAESKKLAGYTEVADPDATSSGAKTTSAGE